MGSFTKWLGAGIGFVSGGPIGAVIGFVLGAVLDENARKDFLKEARRFQQSSSQQNASVQSGDFEISLLILTAIVIKADGKVDTRELNYVRSHFLSMYGKERANHAFKLFKGIIKKNVSAPEVCAQIRQYMSHASRLQLIHFLFGIANADGRISPVEINQIKTISSYLYINDYDFVSIKAMFVKESDSYYKILEIEKSVSNDEVKKAYRKMVKKYHPDKLQGLGEEHIKGAKEKFQKIQKAYEAIKNERGLS